VVVSTDRVTTSDTDLRPSGGSGGSSGSGGVREGEAEVTFTGSGGSARGEELWRQRVSNCGAMARL